MGEPAGFRTGSRFSMLSGYGCTAGFSREDGAHDVSCGVGGCGSCAVLIDGEIHPACVTPVRDRMEIGTVEISRYPPRRRIQAWAAHGVGGVGTPWQLKRSGSCIEVAAFTCGCNLRCPQCQNWRATYNGKEPRYTPHEAAVITTAARKRYGVDRMAVSGGECTLNRRWLASYIRELRELNPDRRARFHVDTNATLLSPDYIDELVAAGMTDIGPDLKGLTPETFMRITGLSDRDAAVQYLETSWKAVRYIVERYSDDLFLGIGIPYNRALISREELEAVAEAIARIDPDVQVCVLDYRPQFRRTDLIRPGIDEMRDVGKIMRGAGLTTVICQTSDGHLGPV
jgi:pyruvate formate lyase activating enzyme